MRKFKMIFFLSLSLICFLIAFPAFAAEGDIVNVEGCLLGNTNSDSSVLEKERTLLSRYIVYPSEESYSGHLGMESFSETYYHEEEYQNYIWTGTLRLIDCKHWTDKYGNPFTTPIYAGYVYVTV